MGELRNILVVSATEAEVAPLLNTFSFKKDAFHPIYTTQYTDDVEVEVLITGVGMTATAYHIGKVLDDHYDMAINAGLAGSFNRNLALGDVVNVVEDHFAELGAEDGERFLSLSDLGLQGIQAVSNTSRTRNPVIDALPQVTGITVNTVHGKEESIARVYERYHPYVESMEGAAFLMACLDERIPCAQVRAVSNYVERRNREAWNIPLAVKQLNQALLAILNELK
jgi:futalosine hydrolase